jgi:hypothetical protein
MLQKIIRKGDYRKLCTVLTRCSLLWIGQKSATKRLRAK